MNNPHVKQKHTHTRILSADFEGLVPHEAVHAQLWKPVELDKETLALRIQKCIRIDPETLHHAYERGTPRSDMTHITI